MELNAEQIIKDLEAMNMTGLSPTIIRNAIALIEEFTKEVEDWKAIAEGYQRLFEDCAEDRAMLTEENERLMIECGNQSTLWRQHFESIYETAKETVRADTVREMRDRILEGLGEKEQPISLSFVRWLIDRITQEMLEGK